MNETESTIPDVTPFEILRDLIAVVRDLAAARGDAHALAELRRLHDRLHGIVVEPPPPPPPPPVAELHVTAPAPRKVAS